jgi:hypothetical protein
MKEEKREIKWYYENFIFLSMLERLQQFVKFYLTNIVFYQLLKRYGK